MMEELYRRLELIEKKTDDCASTVNQCANSMQQCATDIKLIQQDLTHKNLLSEKRMDQMQDLVETQHLVLHGNPRQDTKDRGLIGDVEELKGSEARKKKLYWSTIAAVIMVMVSSFWNYVSGSGKEDHGRSEPTETTVHKTGPDPGDVRRHNRSDRE